MRSSGLGRLIPEASRWLREGSLGRTLPGRVRHWMERQTVAWYPPTGPAWTIPLADQPVEATLLFGGDLAFHRWTPDQEPGEVFEGIAPLLAGCDARIYNLESQLTLRTAPAATIGTFLRADPAAVKALRYLGTTAVTCANNHCLDFGAPGLAESLDRLSAEGVLVAGIRRDGQAGAIVVPVNRVRIGLLAYTDDWNVAERSAGFPGPVAHDPARVRQDIVALRGSTDVLVVQLHWGYEWTMYPMRTLRDWARGYVDAGADVVICHHAHVPMGVERWHQGLVAHGLGNLFFGVPSRGRGHPFRNQSVVLRVGVSRNSVVRAEVIPVHTEGTGRLVVSSGRIRDRVLRGVAYLSQRLDLDGYLDRIEGHLIATQGAIQIRDLAGRLARGDSRGIWERVGYFSRPRQRWLVSRLLEADGFRREAGQTLEAVGQTAGDQISPALADRIRQLERSSERFLAKSIPVGWVP
ncbi:MAG: CapA family protein [Gemmatimonadales bacterium]